MISLLVVLLILTVCISGVLWAFEDLDRLIEEQMAEDRLDALWFDDDDLADAA